MQFLSGIDTFVRARSEHYVRQRTVFGAIGACGLQRGVASATGRQGGGRGGRAWHGADRGGKGRGGGKAGRGGGAREVCAATLTAAVLIVALFVAEVVDFATVRVEHHVEVDGRTSVEDEMVAIELDVFFRELSCEEAHFEVQDNKGKLYLGADVSVRKTPASSGMFGVSSSAVRNKKGEVKGCSVQGSVRVHMVPGNIHVLPDAFSASAPHAHGGFAVGGEGLRDFNASHVIRKLRFAGGVPGVPNPLDGADKVDARVVQYRYHVQVVPTTFRAWTGGQHLGAQMAVTEHVAEADFAGEPGAAIPGFLVQFEFAPMRVVIEETRRPLLELLASLAAILGGIFTVASVLDASLFRAQEMIGKQD
jgi:hypothetical protein